MPYRLVTLSDEQDIRDRWLMGRAAAFEPDTGELFVNMEYESARRLAEEALQELEPPHAPELEAAATRLAERAMLERICRAAIYALSKQNEPDTWNEGNVTRGLSPESLSAAAEDLSGFLPSLANALRKASPPVAGLLE